MTGKKQPPKVKSNPATKFGRAERKQLSNTGRQQAGLKPKRSK